MSQDIFQQIDNTILDLQNSSFQSYERPLKRLGTILQHPDLNDLNQELTSDLDLEAFLAESYKSSGSMVGSAKLNWPNDDRKILGLTLLLINKLSNEPELAVNFSHTYFYESNKFIANIHSMVVQLIIPFARDYKAYILNKGSISMELKKTLSNRIFIVHGHDDSAKNEAARFLEKIGFEVIILHEQANQGKTIIEKIDTYGDVSFAVVLLTPDDEGCKTGETPSSRARQNVILELGYFIGRLGRNKVCALKKGEVEIPSDFLGVVWEDMDSNGGWKSKLARELQAAGHDIDWNKIMR
ncbi:TIR domain-containing protein [Neisseria animalis]|uniref:CD-NTase-associated protein 12/Pycsar effector protein TIR domain-containing protein n=1 Tax=Neisseria animalis TaxID=492 RepID=A0A5P3MQT3_NEIAN|nr:nucleotide-binding protein [Neisseria animalis]QEY23946.1 hypothetical protein D0T90_05075 [Neisseria animalis]ROW31656.1 hypothetical protein CGZ60_09140 [Neisseria animalis]VEE05926.1 ABC-type sugar transport system, periplasmic component [Neisseria animalis]